MSHEEPPFRSDEPIAGTQYRFVEVLGSGGHGTVIVVRHEFLQQRRVMKLLHAELGTDRDLVRRTIAEAQVLARMEHPNLVPVLDGGITSESAPRPFFVMPELRGMPLATMLRRVPQGIGFLRSVELVLGILDGLDFAHTQHKVIHRDIKPANIFLHRTATDTTVPKILDFGIAHFVSSQKHRHTGRSFIGTPRYAAPEQLLGERPSVRTDLYAVGLVLFECLTGSSPFAAEKELRSLIHAQIHGVPPRLKSIMDDVPVELDELVTCLLAKKPEARPESAAQTAVVLRAMKERLARARNVALDGADNRTEPTPMDNLLVTTLARSGIGAPGSSRPAALDADTVPGAPPFADVSESTLETPMVAFDTTEPAAVLPHSPPPPGIDRHAKTNTSREPAVQLASRHDTERIDDLLEGLGAEEPSLEQSASSFSETPALVPASVSTRERPRMRWEEWRSSVLAAIASALLVGTALTIVLRAVRSEPRPASTRQASAPAAAHSEAPSGSSVPALSGASAMAAPASAASSTPSNVASSPVPATRPHRGGPPRAAPAPSAIGFD